MISLPAGYAIKALGVLAESRGGPLLIRQIAEKTGLPTPYLAKIANTLAQRGVLRTQRGVGGGVRLVDEACAISLYRICEALDDPITQQLCMLRTAKCSEERACPAHDFWHQHRERQIAFLQMTTLADVAAFEGRQRELHGVPAIDARSLKNS
jgi:Rrf2 family protein